MARTTIMTVSARDFASRGAVLTVSVLAHVLVYGALSLVPASTPPPRTGLVVTEVIVSEPTPPPPAPRPVTPPRPTVRPKPPTKTAEVTPPTKAIAPPATPTQVELSIERAASASPVDAAPPSAVSAETPREVTAAPPPSVAVSPSAASSGPTFSPTGPAPNGSAAVMAALPPGPSAMASAVTRTAIPRGGYQVTPSYPPTARRLGIEGTALLRVFVDATGHVGDVVVKQSAGHPDLDRAAAEAVRRWRFDPARRGTDAVAMWVELPVEFHLR